MDSDRYIGTNDNRVLRLNASNGILMSSQTSSLQLLAECFQSIDISGSASLYAYSNFVLNNSFLVATEGFLSSSTVPSETTLTIQSLREAPPLSTNIISYQSLKVISSMTSPADSGPFAGNMIWSKTEPSTFPVFAGYQDFVFRTVFTPPTLGLELSSYSAKEFLQISSLVATSYLSTLSTISSFYTQKDIFSTAFTSLSTTEGLYYSTNLSTAFGVSNYTQLTYNQKFGDTLARATIIQLNDQFGLLNAGLSTISTYKTPVYVMASTNKGFIDSYSTPTALSTSTFYNFAAGSLFNFRVNGIFVVSTQLSTLSTSIGSNIQVLSNSLTYKSQDFIISTASTFQSLGLLGYVSSASLHSSVRGLGSLSYVSSASLVSSITGLVGFPSSLTNPFTSTTQGLLTTFPFISTQTLQSSIVSTTSGLLDEVAYTYISSGAVERFIPSTSKGVIDYAGNFNYISTQSLASSLQSTVQGLSSFLYVTSSQVFSSLLSTTFGIPFISSGSLQSTVIGLSNANYVTSLNLQSTTSFFENFTRQFVSTIILPTTLDKQQVDMTRIFLGTGGTASNFYFSSLQFTALGGFESVIQNAQFVTLEYTPVLFFPPSETYSSNYNPTLSTGVQIGDTFYPLTLHRTKVATPSRIDYYTATGSSNLFSEKLQLQMDRQSFLTASSDGFSIVHVFENPFSNGNMFTYASNVSLFTPRSNAFFISIYN